MKADDLLWCILKRNTEMKTKHTDTMPNKSIRPPLRFLPPLPEINITGMIKKHF